MDILLVLTIVSVVAAAGFGAATWWMHQEQCRRSAARVAALASAVDAADDPLNQFTSPVAVSSMFETEPGRAVQGRPIIRLAVGLVMAIVLIVITAMGGGSTADEPQAQSGPTPAAAIAPLELVSMRHTREDSALRVAGLVRNPRTGAPVTRLSAVVFAFDRSGSFLASGRAPVDFMTLEPGDESPFVVSVANGENAVRYRVSFRTDAGVVRHVDRREENVRLAATH